MTKVTSCLTMTTCQVFPIHCYNQVLIHVRIHDGCSSSCFLFSLAMEMGSIRVKRTQVGPGQGVQAANARNVYVEMTGRNWCGDPLEGGKWILLEGV